MYPYVAYTFIGDIINLDPFHIVVSYTVFLRLISRRSRYQSPPPMRILRGSDTTRAPPLILASFHTLPPPLAYAFFGHDLMFFS